MRGGCVVVERGLRLMKDEGGEEAEVKGGVEKGASAGVSGEVGKRGMKEWVMEGV